MGDHAISPPSPPSQTLPPLALPAQSPDAAGAPKRSRSSSTSSSSSSSSSKRLRVSTSSSSAAAAAIGPGRPLSCPGEVANALRHLRAADPALAAVIAAHDTPVFQCFHPPFHCLVRSILYQQLAYKAANNVYNRFIALLGGDDAAVTPAAVLALSPAQLRQIGVSPRKASYLHDLARKFADGILSDAALATMDDRSLASMLTMVKGIGAWSVHMFMIFSLHRPDVLPAADLGFRKGVQMLYGLDDVPRPSQMEQLCSQWRPYRSVGAWYMWRLIEGRAPTNPANAVAQQPQQPQIIDPLQMVPGLGCAADDVETHISGFHHVLLAYQVYGSNFTIEDKHVLPPLLF